MTTVIVNSPLVEKPIVVSDGSSSPAYALNKIKITGIPTLGSDSVETVVMDVKGSGYTAATVAFSGGGGGSGAVANASIGFGLLGGTITEGGSFDAITIGTTGHGSGATFVPQFKLRTPSIFSGGAGYTPGDVLTLVGGTFNTVAQANVFSISGPGPTGPVATLTVNGAGGDYSVLPAGPVSTTGGTGAGAQLSAFWEMTSLNTSPNGNDYDNTTAFTFTGGTILIAPVATPVLASTGRVAFVTVTNGGADYSSAPDVTIDGDGTLATAHSVLATTGDAVTESLVFNPPLPTANYSVSAMHSVPSVCNYANKTVDGVDITMTPAPGTALVTGTLDVTIEY